MNEPVQSDIDARQLLQDVAAGRCAVDQALQRLQRLPFEQLPFATLDHHRALRRGYPEVIYCAGKTPAQVAEIALRQSRVQKRVLGTRATLEQYVATRALLPEIQYDELSRCLWLDQDAGAPRRSGVALVTAGTSDLPVAEEAAITLRLLGHEPARVTDVGVAGLHRIGAQLPVLQQASVIIVVAGMEGALPSVVSGLTSAPLIAVPTSVGYGASFGGLAALLAMLNSCSPGVAVVNIDNGFGAACIAASINSRINHP